jgi:signal transduction histidine kinase
MNQNIKARFFQNRKRGPRFVRVVGANSIAKQRGVHIKDMALDNQGFIKILCDSTAHKQAEEPVQHAHDELEKCVQERTTKLKISNTLLLNQIDEKQHIEEELRRRNRQLTAMNNFSAAVSSCLELPAVFTALEELIADKMAISGGLFFYNALQDQVSLIKHWGLPAKILRHFNTLPVAGFYFEPVIRQQTTLLIEDFRQVPAFLKLKLHKSRPKWLSFACVPVSAKGEIQCVFAFFSQQPDQFTEEEVAFFQMVGQQVGVAIYNARLFTELINGRTRLQQLAQQVTQAQEEERRRVARDLHDEAGQSLTILLLHLAILQETAQETYSSLSAPLAEAVAMTKGTMESIRRLAHDLRPPALDITTLDKVLESLCENFARRSSITVTYQGDSDLPLTDVITTSFYRLLQEALTNVNRHAKASQVWVTFKRQSDHLYLLVEDNGRGLTNDSTGVNSQRPPGIGLTGMRERLEILGGYLRLEARRGGGVALEAFVPLNDPG